MKLVIFHSRSPFGGSNVPRKVGRKYKLNYRKGLITLAKKSNNTDKVRVRPALTPEARENQLISLAIDRAEQQLLDGTATSQVIVHFLKLGSSKDRLEKEKLETENQLLRKKISKIDSEERIDELYREAIKAMQTYSGHPSTPDEEDSDD